VTFIVFTVFGVGSFIYHLWADRQPWSGAAEDNFLSSCMAEGAPRSACQCAYDLAKAEYSWDDFVYMDGHADGAMANRYYDRVEARCY
jgi:hypothetical protein